MLVVLVDVRVRPGCAEPFAIASRDNARASRGELGVARFELLVDPSDELHFLLEEVYVTPDAAAAHKETAHYQLWRDTVEPLMAQPRSSSKWNTVDYGGCD
jgi:(4S)-4-hydroxy-5-phosphonooxypentane-2,3-dione isomerase